MADAIGRSLEKNTAWLTSAVMLPAEVLAEGAVTHQDDVLRRSIPRRGPAAAGAAAVVADLAEGPSYSGRNASGISDRRDMEDVPAVVKSAETVPAVRSIGRPCWFVEQMPPGSERNRIRAAQRNPIVAGVDYRSSARKIKSELART